MSDLVPDPFDFDMAAAGLQADAGDIASLLEVLRVKLQENLGPAVSVERQGGLFNKHKDKVKSLTVVIGDNSFTVTHKHGRAICRKAHAVRGITLSSEEVPLPQWLRQLMVALQQEAESSQAARLALEKLLT